MEPITLRLPTEIMRRLQEEARRTGLEPVAVAEGILIDRLAPDLFDERERAIRALREAGMLSELSDEMRAFADELQRRIESETDDAASVRQQLLSCSLEPPLSETILAQRGPKV
jgi:hypothetical protein